MSTSSTHATSTTARTVAAMALLQSGLTALVLAAVLHLLHEVRLARAGVDALLAGHDAYLLVDTPWWVLALAVVGVGLVGVGVTRIVRATSPAAP